MKIEITYDTKSFDPEKFKATMDLVAQYAKNAKDLKVCATDTAFVCGGLDEFLEPEKIKGVKEICTCMEHDLQEKHLGGDDDPEPEEPVNEGHGSEEETPGKGENDIGVCKNCDEKFEKERKNQAFCSDECRKEYFNHRQRSRKERAAGTDRPKKVCPICNEEFVPYSGRQNLCNKPECKKMYHNWKQAQKNNPSLTLEEYIKDRDFKLAEKKRIAELKQRQCAYDQCGKMFSPTTDDQKYCSKECKAAAHQQRKEAKLAEVPEVPTGRYKHICGVCEQPFSDDEPVSNFCPKCLGQFGLQECIGLAEDTKARKLAQTVVRPGQRQYKVCPKCGHNFDTIDPNQFFCDKCTAKALHQPKVKPLKPLKPEPIPPQN